MEDWLKCQISAFIKYRQNQTDCKDDIVFIWLCVSATKAQNTDVKSVNKDGFQPCLHVFDVLLYNNKVLTNLPLKERLKYIEKVFTPCEGRMIMSQHKEARTK